MKLPVVILLTHLFVSLISPSTAMAQKQTEDIPDGLLSCFLRVLPPPGTSATYKVVATQLSESKEPNAKRVEPVNSVLRLAIVEIPDFEDYAWLEVSLQKDGDDKTQKIFKNLIELKKSETPMTEWRDRLIPFGWAQSIPEEPISIDKDFIRQSPFMGLLLSRRKPNKLPNLKIETKAGSFECETFEFSLEDLQTTFKCYLNSKAGFGLVKMDVVSKERGLESRVELTLEEIGHDAETLLPSKTLRTLLREDLKETKATDWCGN